MRLPRPGDHELANEGALVRSSGGGIALAHHNDILRLGRGVHRGNTLGAVAPLKERSGLLLQRGIQEIVRVLLRYRTTAFLRATRQGCLGARAFLSARPRTLCQGGQEWPPSEPLGGPGQQLLPVNTKALL